MKHTHHWQERLDKDFGSSWQSAVLAKGTSKTYRSQTSLGRPSRPEFDIELRTPFPTPSNVIKGAVHSPTEPVWLSSKYFSGSEELSFSIQFTAPSKSDAFDKSGLEADSAFPAPEELMWDKATFAGSRGPINVLFLKDSSNNVFIIVVATEANQEILDSNHVDFNDKRKRSTEDLLLFPLLIFVA